MISHLDLKMEFGIGNQDIERLDKIDEWAAPTVFRSRLGNQSNTSIIQSMKSFIGNKQGAFPGYSSTGGTNTIKVQMSNTKKKIL